MSEHWSTKGDAERHQRKSDDADVLAAVERIRILAAEAKLGEFDWQALKADRDDGRP
jgi:hypothetical protein